MKNCNFNDVRLKFKRRKVALNLRLKFFMKKITSKGYLFQVVGKMALKTISNDFQMTLT